MFFGDFGDLGGFGGVMVEDSGSDSDSDANPHTYQQLVDIHIGTGSPNDNLLYHLLDRSI